MKKGFTLLELSIVLVIIGLIIGGITVGQEMIRSAELNSVISDVNKYKVAVNTFKLKYNALPGDMDNAQDYWGIAHATPATCQTTFSTGTETCNGDGNGQIGLVGNVGTYYEVFRAWQHLANAEIISGSFVGARDTGGHPQGNATIGVNIPSSKISGSGYVLIYAGTDNNYANPTVNNHIISWGVEGTGFPVGGALNPAEQFSLDTKHDDGKPATGKLLSFDDSASATTDCVTDDTLDAEYELSETAGACQATFIID